MKNPGCSRKKGGGGRGGTGVQEKSPSRERGGEAFDDHHRSGAPGEPTWLSFLFFFNGLLGFDRVCIGFLYRVLYRVYRVGYQQQCMELKMEMQEAHKLLKAICGPSW